jgi:hypothetical protein
VGDCGFAVVNVDIPSASSYRHCFNELCFCLYDRQNHRYDIAESMVNASIQTSAQAPAQPSEESSEYSNALATIAM